MSAQIAETLATDDIKLLLAYEYAKAQQFENFKVKGVQLACLFWPKFIRRLLLTDLRAVLQERAYQTVKQGLDHQYANIPLSIRGMLPSNTNGFLDKIMNGVQLSNSTSKSNRNAFFVTAQAYLINSFYFICLIVITSNLSHFIFELID